MKFYNIHTHRASIENDEIVLRNYYPWELLDTSYKEFSVGIHPWHYDKSRVDLDWQRMHEVVTSQSCLAIGECGLDNRIALEMEVQEMVFEQHIDFAQQNGKPLIIHCVGAYDRFLSVIKRKQPKTPVVMHGFSKNRQLMQQLIKGGCYISIGKYAMLNPKLEDVIRQIPIDKLFLETDSSDYKISEIYQKVASILNIEIVTLVNQLEKNFNNVFLPTKIKL